ncbi:MAG: sulfatase-like hydrolase/transferase [Blastomonas sp.]
MLAHRRFPPLAIAAAAIMLALAELLLADRKYGLFTGGFGQSQAVDSVVERAMFALGYGLAMAALVSAFAWLAAKILRRSRGWPFALHVIALGGGAFLFALVVQLQLHAYFSDAVSFALLKQLGGGSLGDAMLFAANEIAIGLAALAIAVLGYWLIWRWLVRRYPVASDARQAAPGGRSVILLLLATFAFALFVGRVSGDVRNGLARTMAWRVIAGSADALSDVDRDGYGLFGRLVDGAPFDPDRHPLALDTPGNGVDEDGLGGDLDLLDVPAALPLTRIGGERPNLVIVVMESVRGDVLGKRINGKPVAPNLEALAGEGGAIVPAYSHVGFTTQSLKSLFSGALAPKTGAPSLFRDLKASGYRIGVFSGQPEDFGGIAETVGMRKTADQFFDGAVLKDKRAFAFGAQGSVLVDEKHLLAAFDTAYADGTNWDRPNFLYFNFQSPHFPYHHDGVPALVNDQPLARSDISVENREALQRTYWNAVAYSDSMLGALVARLKDAGQWDNSVLVVTGDHGEALFEHGFLGHGHRIDREQFATFLVANRPLADIDAPIGLSDYRAIILRLLGAAVQPMRRDGIFMHVGDLDRPTQIGLAEKGGRITSLRLDTDEACLVEKQLCQPRERFSGKNSARIERLIRRWGSERWTIYGAQEKRKTD